MLNLKFISSLEKVFPDQKIEDFATLETISALRGERISVQLIYSYEPNVVNGAHTLRHKIELSGDLAPLADMREVRCVPVTMPTNPYGQDDNYLRTTPGLYPDVLIPLRYEGALPYSHNTLKSIWIDINVPEDLSAGEHTLTFKVKGNAHVGEHEASFTLEVIDASLPKDEIYFTQWFHCDCLANYYETDVWSDKHWKIVENFARVAAKNGINLLLTPVFTPPLDTTVGGERRTTQLIGVTKNNGEYTFDFTLLDKWVDMCDRCGIKYLEVSHLFTQWGVEHAPKIMATVDGEYKRIFGWDTAATCDEYKAFLRQFLTEFIAHMKNRGDDKRLFFHISDEPGLHHLENYKAAKDMIADLIEPYFQFDALSKFDFWKTGAVKNPVCSNNHITPFLEAKVPGLWTYYCVSQPVNVSNRYISMPLWRTRSIGMQIYKYNIEGFLQWGYNFYNNQYSDTPINPYLITDCDGSFPAGDAYSVYPGANGEALESIRIIAHHQGLTDIKAMKLCEKYYSHDEVVAAIEEIFGQELTFETCAKSAKTMLAIREKINSMIKAAVK